MFAKTVSRPVDRHIANLVDAINDTENDVRTFACCSGHPTKPGVPYVAFRGTDWDFIRSLLAQITAINKVTMGQTRLSLTEMAEERFVGSIRLVTYQWLEVSDQEWERIVYHSGPPPRRLVRLWWDELDEVARLVRDLQAAPSATFLARFQRSRARNGLRRDCC